MQVFRWDTVGGHAETRADMQGWRPEMQKREAQCAADV